MDKPDTKPNRKAGEDTSESTLASDIMGNNQLQGDDQESVRNERHAVPDTKLEPDSGPVESAEMLDKDVRARRELHKGARDDDKTSAEDKNA